MGNESVVIRYVLSVLSVLSVLGVLRVLSVLSVTSDMLNPNPALNSLSGHRVPNQRFAYGIIHIRLCWSDAREDMVVLKLLLLYLDRVVGNNV